MRKLIISVFTGCCFWVNSQEYTLFQDENSKFGFVDSNGEVVIEPIFENAGNFSQGKAAVLLSDRVGFIDSTGKIVIPCKYDWTNGFSKGYAMVKLNSKFGFIDLQGNEITPIRFDYAFHFNHGYSIVNQGGSKIGGKFSGGKFGVIDTTGKFVVKPIYEFIHAFRPIFFRGKEQLIAEVVRGSRVIIEDDNTLSLLFFKAGLIDATGKEVIPVEYGEFNFRDHNRIWAMKGRKWGMLNHYGKKLTPFKYDESPQTRYEIYDSDTTYLDLVIVDSKYGFINLNGKEIIKSIYEDYRTFSEGLIGLQKDGKWGFVNLEGKVVIPFVFDRVWSFNNGVAHVELNGEEFNIDRHGKRQD